MKKENHSQISKGAFTALAAMALMSVFLAKFFSDLALADIPRPAAILGQNQTSPQSNGP